MTITIEQAMSALPKFIAKAQAGEEILIETQDGQPFVRLAPVSSTAAATRLTPHPELAGSVKYLDPDWTLPLPAADWGGLAHH